MKTNSNSYNYLFCHPRADCSLFACFCVPSIEAYAGC